MFLGGGEEEEGESSPYGVFLIRKTKQNRIMNEIFFKARFYTICLLLPSNYKTIAYIVLSIS